MLTPELKQALLTDLPVAVKYALQKLEPTEQAQLTSEILASIAAIDPSTGPVTEAQLFDAAKGLVNGVVSVIPEGKAKEITTTVLNYAEEVAGKITGDNHDTVIKLVVDGIEAVKSVENEIKA